MSQRPHFINGLRVVFHHLNDVIFSDNFDDELSRTSLSLSLLVMMCVDQTKHSVHSTTVHSILVLLQLGKGSQSQ